MMSRFTSPQLLCRNITPQDLYDGQKKLSDLSRKDKSLNLQITQVYLRTMDKPDTTPTKKDVGVTSKYTYALVWSLVISWISSLLQSLHRYTSSQFELAAVLWPEDYVSKTMGIIWLLLVGLLRRTHSSILKRLVKAQASWRTSQTVLKTWAIERLLEEITVRIDNFCVFTQVPCSPSEHSVRQCSLCFYSHSYLTITTFLAQTVDMELKVVGLILLDFTASMNSAVSDLLGATCKRFCGCRAYR